MSAFVNPGLLWGLGLLAIPLLIHLINLVRHQHVHWAAMEFLLASRKKNNTWIKLKELLLLLLRLAAVAAVVLLLAQPLLQNQWGRLFGKVKTHHVVVLDDSFSMSDRWANTSGFEEGKRLIGRLATQASRQPTPQTFTVLRTSRAPSGAAQYDLLQERVDSDFQEALDATLRPLATSEQATAFAPALTAVEQLLPEIAGDDVVLYLVSDFRSRDWDEPGPMAESLHRLSAASSQTYMINCVDAGRPNLAIAALAARPGTRAAGVPLAMQVTVQNFDDQPAENVAVMLTEDGRERPAVTIDQIPAGGRETRTFEVFFSTAGTHDVTARLAGDAVAADNARYAVVELPVAVPVLIIDGDPASRNGKFLDTVFQPGGAARTGLQPQIERPDYLNHHALEKFQSIYVTDIDRLDGPAVAALENYARAGGGVMFFVGPATQPKFFNEKLYRDGEGLFPAPLLRETQLLVDRLEKGADIEPLDVGVLQIFAGERNSYLAGVTVERYMSVPKSWKPAAETHTQIWARLRNGDPLVIEREYGRGRVVAMLSSAGPVWNNWGRNPSFVVALLELQSFLAQPVTADESRLVGTPINLQLDPARYQPQVRLVPPNPAETGEIVVDATSTPNGLTASLPQTLVSGVYTVQLTTTDGHEESRRYAYNVEADEGNLALESREQLAVRLPDVRYEYRPAPDFQVTAQELAGSNLSDWLLYLLVGILVGEQVLAYSASYHPRARGGAR